MRHYQIFICYANVDGLIVKSGLINESEIYNEFYSVIHELGVKIGKGLHVQETYYEDKGYFFTCSFIYNGCQYWVDCAPVIGLDTNMIVKSFMDHIKFDEFMKEQYKKLL